MTDAKYVRMEYDGQVAVVTIDRPAKLNALNPEVVRELGEAIAHLTEADDVRGIIVTGAGDKAFVAGADIGVLAEMDPLTGVEVSRAGQVVFLAIERCPKPVVAAVGGYALGGGCELALACHLRVAVESARFGLPEVSLGIIPGYGGTIRLSRLVGLGRALELTLTGEMIGAERALEIGLVNSIAEPGGHVAAAKELLGRILANGPVALKLALQSVYRAFDCSIEEALEHEASRFGILASTEDMKEGMTAFLEKRKASFSGR